MVTSSVISFQENKNKFCINVNTQNKQQQRLVKEISFSLPEITLTVMYSVNEVCYINISISFIEN